MSHATLQPVPGDRRYLLASLSVHWQFRRMMRPAGLGHFRGGREPDGSANSPGAAQDRAKARHHGTSESR